MRILLLIFILFFQTNLFCQRENLDTLTQRLSEAVEDSSRIKILNQIGVYYYFSKTPQEGRTYHEQALDLALKRGYKKQTAKTLYYLGYLDYAKDAKTSAIHIFEQSKNIYDEMDDADGIVRVYRILGQMARENGEYTEAIEYLKRAEKYIPLLPKESARLGRVTLNEIGHTYWEFLDYETATKYYFEQYEWAEQDKDSTDMALVFSTLGNRFLDIEENEKALEYLQKAYSLRIKLGWERAAAYTASSLAECYVRMNHLDTAEVYAKVYFDFFKDYGQKSSLGEAYKLLGKIYLERKDKQIGFDYLSKALTLFRETEEELYIVLTQLYMAGYHYSFGNYNQAIPILERILPKARNLINLREITHHLALSYEATGNHFEAVEMYKLHMEYKDSVIKVEDEKKLANLEIRYDVKEKENSLQLKESQLNFQKQALKRQRILNGVIGFAAFLLLVLVGLIWKVSGQRKRTNEQLRQLDKAKSQFFTNISHELRTPLTLITAPLENAIEKSNSKAIKKDLSLALSNSRKLLTLVNEIMDLSKLESGKLKVNETAVSLEKLLRRIFFSYHSLAQLRGFILSFSFHLPNHLVVKLDVEKFEKVLNNLLSNAFKYSQPGGVITLRALEIGGNMRIEVNDRGKGIPPEELDKIFDRFYQIEDENEPLQGGTGIGLAYAKEIARLFKGDLTVESKVGEGTTFIFDLPLKKTSLKSAASKVTSSESSEEGVILRQSGSNVEMTPSPLFSEDVTSTFYKKKPRILIVEDNTEMSQFLVQTLYDEFECTTAMDGIQALDLLKTKKFDLITSDVMMPNMDGFTFLEKLKENETVRHTPVILLTAKALEEDKLRGFSLGIDDYLTKPFSTKELLARVNNLLKNKALREQIQKEEAEEEQPTEVLSYEQQLLKNAENLVLDNIDNPNFKVPELASALNYSRRQIERIIKKSTGLSPGEFIREIRLQKAYRLIESRQFATIAEVRYEVGMENASNFTQKFRERFGKLPSEVY